MKTLTKRHRQGFTVPELIVVTIVLAVVVAILFPNLLHRPRVAVPRIRCVYNLKEVGTAYRLWASDNGGVVPPQQSVSNGGWKELLTNADQGALCWTNYVIMQNEMGQSPKLVNCPQDERQAAVCFTNGFGNTNVSYFVGVSATWDDPKAILGGDRNLCDASLPATDFGYSPTNGAGNDVAVKTARRFNATSWSPKMHGLTWGGNLLFGDGNVQQGSSASLRLTWLPNAPPTTNWPVGHAPSVPSIRLVFP